MKKLLMALALLPLMAAAETWYDPSTGFTWTYSLSGGKVIIGFENYWSSSVPIVSPEPSGNLVVPTTVNGVEVVGIGDLAFWDFEKITSVTIPSGVRSISYNAFPRSLVGLYVDELNRNYKSVDGVLYDKAGKTLLKWPNATGAISIPLGVVEIGREAFLGCSGMTTVNIPSSVTHVGRSAFQECGGLTHVTVPSKVLSIGTSAFAACEGLFSVEVQSGVAEIGANAFAGCVNLEEVVIPASVTSIGAHPFEDCANLKAITVAGANAKYKSVKGLLLDKGGKKLIQCPGGIRETVIPRGVTTIEKYAFAGCGNLESITIPSSVVECGIFGLGVFSFDESSLDYKSSLRTVYVDKGDGGRVYDLIAANWQDNPYLNVEELTFIELEPPQSVSFLPGEAVSLDTGLIGYTASGLPSGLKYDKTTGMITGAATKTTAAEGVIVKFTKSGAETEEMTIVVGPPPKIGVALEGDTDGCKVTGAGSYLVGKKVTLKVTTKKGTAFTGFYKDGEPWPNEADCKKTSLAYTMTKEDVSLVAKFEKEKMSVGCVGLSCRSFTAGVAGSSEGIPLEIETQSGIKSVKVEKLPAGMKYDAKKKVITGAPTKAGDNTVVITVTAVSGAVEKKEIAVPVAAMPETAVGTFNGFVANGEQRIGTFALTTTDAGKLTAKVITIGGTVSFSGTCWDSLEDGVCKVTLRTKKGEFMTLALDSNAAWDANQLTGTYSPPNMTGWFDLSAQRNAFVKTWYFTAVGDEQTGWTFAYTKDAKAAALTVTLKADGSTAIAGKLGAIKVSASGSANVGGMREGAIIADFAPIVTVNKVKRALSIRTNLWFDRSNDHAEGAGGANFAE